MENQDQELNEGVVACSSYRSNFTVVPWYEVSPEKQYPELFYTITLTGKNTTGGKVTTVEIRFRDPRHIVTNPVCSDHLLIIDMQKHDFTFIKELLSKSIDSENGPAGLYVRYKQRSGKNEYDVDFYLW